MSYRLCEPKHMDYLCGKKPGFGWPVDLSSSLLLCGGWVGIWTSVIPTTHVRTFMFWRCRSRTMPFANSPINKVILVELVVTTDSQHISELLRGC